jgi:hypothetical protein
MEEASVARWLTSYIEAWKSYDPVAIGKLFSEDALYRYHPWQEPTPSHVRGREAIVASWLDDQDPAGSWTAEYRPWLVHDDRAVAVGVSRYLGADGSTWDVNTRTSSCSSSTTKAAAASSPRST